MIFYIVWVLAASCRLSLMEIFPIYQHKLWTIRRWDDRSIASSSHHIILKIVGFLLNLQFALAWQITGRCSWSFSLIVQKTGESTSFGRNSRCPISFNPIVLCVPIQIEKSIKWKGNLLSLSYFFPMMVQEPHWVETRIIDCNQCLEYTKKVHWSSLVVCICKQNLLV